MKILLNTVILVLLSQNAFSLEVTGGLDVQIHETKNFDEAELAKIEQARAMLRTIVNSEEFKQKVIHFTYQGQEQFVQNNGLTNAQVYEKMMAGAETLPQATQANQTIDLFLQLYYKRGNVIGYTDPTVHTIFMNSYFFDYAAINEVAMNIVHEWMHKLGFDHDYKSTKRRPSSVPYAIGYIVRDMGTTH